MMNAHLWRRRREDLHGIPAPLPPGVSLAYAGGLRAAWVKFQAMRESRRRTYTKNIKEAQASRLWRH